jgi:pyruvate kinase
MSVAPRRTKIVCTIGPATSEEPMTARYKAANVFGLYFADKAEPVAG